MKRIVFILFCIVQTVNGQTPFFKQIALNRDSPNLTVNTLLFCKNGFLWAGTSEGLYRSDGNDHHLLATSDTIKRNVTALFEDNTGVIWIGTKEGEIGFVKDDTLRIIKAFSLKPSVAITSINADTDAIKWLTTAGNGVYYLLDSKFYHIGIEEGLSDDYCYTSAPDKSGNMWIGTDQGLSLCTSKNGKKVLQKLQVADGLCDNIVKKIVIEGSKMFLATQENGLCIYDFEQNGFLKQKAETVWNYGSIDDIILNKTTNEIWVATESGGLLYFRNPEEKTYSLKQQSAKLFSSVYSVAIDHQNNVWVATDRGLFRSHGQWLTFLEQYAGADINNVHEVAFLDSNQMVVSIKNKIMLISFNTSTIKEWTILPSEKNIDVSGLYIDKEKYIWIGTLGNGVFRINPSKNEIKKIEVPFDYSSILYINGNEKNIWLGTFGGAALIEVEQLNTDNLKYKVRIFSHESPLGNYYVYCVYRDVKGRFWFGTDQNGIVLLDDNKFVAPFSGKFNGRTVYSITGDNNDAIWFSVADEGIVCLNGDSFKLYNRSNGIRDLNITSIAVLDDNSIAIVNKRGIDILNHKSGSVMYLGTENNLDNLNSDINSVAKDSIGRIWFGTVKGMVVLDPKLLKQNTVPELSKLNMIQPIFKNRSGITPVFRHNENTVTFEYAATWFTNPGRILYQYKLDGLNADWIATKDIKQVFPNLPPGKYVFRIRTSIDPQFTFNNESSFSFEIKKPFWQEDWFYFSSLLLAILLVYLFIKVRDARMKKLQQLKNDSIRFQFETLRNQVNPHFLFNSFNTLIDIIEHDKEHAVDYVENLSAFFRNIVTYKDKETIKLSEEIKIAKAFYFIQQKRFGSNLQLLIDEHSLYDEKYVVPMVLQLLLENAIKHNEISKEKNLEVHVAFTNDRIIISNNTNPKVSKDESTGTGLRNIIARYRLLTDKTVQIESSQDYFVVSLPLINHQ